jgi:glycosyltransferase involved in cell wall biosynthesis
VTARAAETVGVVIPAYQAEATIGEAIASVLAQSVAVEQVVVVDDGSTDRTRAQAQAFGAPVTVIAGAHEGPAKARNRGLMRLTTEWVAFLDADDRWHPDKLRDQLRLAAARPDAVLVATDWMRWQAAFPPKPDRVRVSAWSTRDLWLLNRFQTSTVLLRRAVAVRAGGFDPALDGVEDWDMWIRASRAGAVVALRWPYVMYRDVATGYSKDLRRVYRTMVRMLEREATQSGRLPGSILAWHRLRFWVGFRLAGDPEGAREVLRELGERGLWPKVPAATARWLVPFLAGRAWRRWRGPR